MKRAKLECPGCGRVLNEFETDPGYFGAQYHSDPNYLEARHRAEGRAPQPNEPSKTRDGRCTVCGSPLSKNRRDKKTDGSRNDEADGPLVRRTERQGHPYPGKPSPPPVSSRRDETKEERSRPAANFLGFNLLAWSLMGAGCLVVVLLGGGLLVVLVALSSSSDQPTTSSAPPVAVTQPQRPARPQPPPARQPPPATNYPGLLAYWNFDEGKGAQAADTSGNGLHAKLVNAAWTQGVRGTALNLTGPDSYLDYSDSPRLSFAAGGAFTLAFWTRTQRANATLLSQRNSRHGGAVIDLLLRGGKIQGQVRQDGDDVFGPVTVDGGLVNDGSWHHVALTRDGDLVELLLDDASQGRNRGEIAAGAIPTDLRALGSERFWIARNGHFGDPHFQGDMDEFCIFDRVLTAKEIETLAGR